MACLDGKIYVWILFFSVIFSAVPSVHGVTDPRDLYAINVLYSSLGFPPLHGWIPIEGDPCGEPTWQGVECVISNITGLKLSGANLSGELGDSLGSFPSIISIDLSNNHIGGDIPSNLPVTLKSLSLSDNNFTGPIPDALSSLGQLTNLSLNNNQFTGPIPDAFVQLTGLINLDLSGNNLTSDLPPSMRNLSSLTTLRLQNNQLTGLLDVLQDLPLNELNIENNLFSGPIPDKLKTIPIFISTGNPFNTTTPPPPPPTPAASPPPLLPSDAPSPGDNTKGPSPVDLPEKKKNATKHIAWIRIVGTIIIVALVLGIGFVLFKFCKRIQPSERTAENQEKEAFSVRAETRKRDQPIFQVEKVPKEVVLNKGNDHRLDLSRFDLPSPLGPIVADPIFTEFTPVGKASRSIDSTEFFTVASLQQYTNSFSQENLIGKGTLGVVYRAHLPDGRVLAVKKLDRAASGHMSDGEFLDLVSKISKIRHPNIIEFVGYCLEHGQRLLVYNYSSNGTLYEALHYDEDIKKKLSWNARMRLALHAARALEYLHEVCEPPVVHLNFKSANVLLDEDLIVRVSACGLAPLSSNYMDMLQGSGYGAPELEMGSYSYQSDVYSFGVVMLELLTGRKAYDRFLPRGEQYLVRWAFSQLHDIDALSRMVDPSLNGAYPSKSLSRLADIIMLCIQPEPEFRPPMSEILQKLMRMIQQNS